MFFDTYMIQIPTD